MFGRVYTYKIEIGRDAQTFLDVEIAINIEKKRITTKSTLKPTNYSKGSSNVPNSTLGAIVCSLSRRYIVINDDETAYRERRKRMIEDLITAQWHESQIRRLKPIYHPSYSNRQLFIEHYMAGFRARVNEQGSMDINDDIFLFKFHEIDENVVIFKTGKFNGCYDRHDKLRRILDDGMEKLPDCMHGIEIILNYHRSPSLSKWFYAT